ncbi:MAG: sulfate/thiosulfate transport system substrate-binding protein [Blastocatellia bacterium]|jgi:sulfate transport system substrate-binding protein|nr:sulfate/thiosulfate transport system substrate-binding protein [Blastocatellia bacterium]
MWLNKNRTLILGLTILGLLLVNACLPKSGSEGGGGSVNITLYGFSIMKESLEKGIYPAFVAKAKREHNVDIQFTSSFAGSETVTNQILQGVKAQIAILSIERDAQRLKDKGFVTSDWRLLPQKGIVNKTPFVIVVRKGNPKGIHEFSDLAKPGLKLIHPDPVSSGGAQWSILAIYGSQLMKSERESNGADHAQAIQMLQAVWRNVISTPGSAREARTQFESGYGDALITYELDALLMKEGNAKADAEIVIPEATILSEHPAVVVDRNVSANDRPVIDAFMKYLWTEEAQRIFVKFHFRSATSDALTQENKELATIKYPFTVDYFGGWGKAYPDVIEGVFRDQVQKRK